MLIKYSAKKLSFVKKIPKGMIYLSQCLVIGFVEIIKFIPRLIKNFFIGLWLIVNIQLIFTKNAAIPSKKMDELDFNSPLWNDDWLNLSDDPRENSFFDTFTVNTSFIVWLPSIVFFFAMVLVFCNHIEIALFFSIQFANVPVQIGWIARDYFKKLGSHIKDDYLEFKERTLEQEARRGDLSMSIQTEGGELSMAESGCLKMVNLDEENAYLDYLYKNERFAALDMMYENLLEALTLHYIDCKPYYIHNKKMINSMIQKAYPNISMHEKQFLLEKLSEEINK